MRAILISENIRFQGSAFNFDGGKVNMVKAWNFKARPQKFGPGPGLGQTQIFLRKTIDFFTNY